MVLDHALSLSRPCRATWYNTRGSESRIDFAFYGAPRGKLIDDQVAEGPEHVLETDHRPVVITMPTAWGKMGKRKRIRNSRCGKWKVNLIQAHHECNACAENLELSARDLDLACLEKICTTCATRANSCRYRDPPEIKQLIADRRALHGSESRKARKALDNLHLTYVTSIVRPQYDPFTSCLNNWTTRRRAARMAAHLVGHVA